MSGSQTQPTASAEQGPAVEDHVQEELVQEDLIEEVSIDGMCGVY